MALTPAERKAEQRRRDKELGLRDVAVKVHQSRVDELRAYALKLQKPKNKSKK